MNSACREPLRIEMGAAADPKLLKAAAEAHHKATWSMCSHLFLQARSVVEACCGRLCHQRSPCHRGHRLDLRPQRRDLSSGLGRCERGPGPRGGLSSQGQSHGRVQLRQGRQTLPAASRKVIAQPAALRLLSSPCSPNVAPSSVSGSSITQCSSAAHISPLLSLGFAIVRRFGGLGY